MLNRRLLVYTSGRVTNQPPEGLIITVIDYDTKQPVANAHVDIRDASGIMHISTWHYKFFGGVGRFRPNATARRLYY